MALKLAGSSSGFVALDAPASAGSNTLVLPTSNGSAGQVLKNGSTAGTLEFGAGGIEATHQGVCKAWVNFNGTGTVAINQDFGVSSITDHGTGDWTVNFDSDFADNDYCFVGMAQNGEGTGNHDSHVVQSAYYDGQAVGSIRLATLRTRYDAVPPQYIDSKAVCVAFFR